ncbi:hypothetical protein ACKWTF_015840 [Chironomus riparius]
MIYFFEALSAIQNSSFHLLFLTNKTDVDDLSRNRKLHLSLNTAFSPNLPGQKLLTYETKSFCALVPHPNKVPFWNLIITKPFDGLTWMFFGVSIFTFVVVWRIFRGCGAVDSHWQLAAGILKIFVGQGADFSRKNRFVLAVLLNIICISIIILKINYESQIASSTIDPIVGNQLKTVEDLLSSNYEVIANNAFVNVYKNTTEFIKLRSRLSKSNEPLTASKSKILMQQRFIFIRLCNTAEFVMNQRLPKGKIVSDFFYILPEKLTSQYVRLEASYMNPFIEKFQYFMDLSFQAGLPQMWKVLAHQNYSKSKKFQPKNEADFLKLKDLISLFLVVSSLYCISFLVLLIEIFYHDCLRNLKVKQLFCDRKCIKKRQKVRFIIVKPIK